MSYHTTSHPMYIYSLNSTQFNPIDVCAHIYTYVHMYIPVYVVFSKAKTFSSKGKGEDFALGRQKCPWRQKKKGGQKKSSYTHCEITIGGEPCGDCYTHPRIRLQHTCSQPPCTMRTSICRNKCTYVCIYMYIGFRNSPNRLFYIDIYKYVYIYKYIGTCHVMPHRALCIYTYMRIDVHTRGTF